jgi:hypothetical protein
MNHTSQCIKYLDRAELLYMLWQHAWYLPFMPLDQLDQQYWCTLRICRVDIANMILNKKLVITTYYGKRLNLDLSGDTLDLTAYVAQHGEPPIADLQKKTLRSAIMAYYKCL